MRHLLSTADLSRDESIRVPLDDALFTALDGLRYLRPEIVLTYPCLRHWISVCRMNSSTPG